MGCTDSRTLKLDEEKVISTSELILGFHKNNCNHADLVFRKFAYSEAFNVNQWNEACSTLKLAAEDSSALIHKFYKQFERNGKYDLKLLLLLSILLTKGTEIDKAKLLFEIYDYDYTLTVSRNEISSMLSDIMNLSVDKLSMLSLENPALGQDITKLNTYIIKLKYRHKDAVNKLTTEIMSGLSSLRQDMFIDAIKSPNVKCILTSSGMRRYLNDFYSTPPKPWESSSS